MTHIGTKILVIAFSFAILMSGSLAQAQVKGTDIDNGVKGIDIDDGRIIGIPACQEPDVDHHYRIASAYMQDLGDEYVVDRKSARGVGPCNNGIVRSTAFTVYKSDYPIGEVSDVDVPVGVVTVNGETERASFQPNGIDDGVITLPACQEPDVDHHYRIATAYMQDLGDEYVVDRKSARPVGFCKGAITLSTAFTVFIKSNYPTGEVKDFNIFAGVVTVNGETEKASFQPAKSIDDGKGKETPIVEDEGSDPPIVETEIITDKRPEVRVFKDENGTSEVRDTAMVRVTDENENVTRESTLSVEMLEPTRILLKEARTDRVKNSNSTDEIVKDVDVPLLSFVETQESVDVKDDGLFIREKKVTLLPSDAFRVIKKELNTTEDDYRVELRVDDQDRPVYETTATQPVKILGLFNSSMDTKVIVDAEDGSTRVERPWWSFLAF